MPDFLLIHGLDFVDTYMISSTEKFPDRRVIRLSGIFFFPDIPTSLRLIAHSIGSLTVNSLPEACF